MECPICYEALIEADVHKTKCNHCFHESCMTSWLREHSTCPMCRKVIVQEVVHGYMRLIDEPNRPDPPSYISIIDRIHQIFSDFSDRGYLPSGSVNVSRI